MRKIRLLKELLFICLILAPMFYAKAQPDKLPKVPIDIENFTGINVLGNFEVFISEGNELEVRAQGDSKSIEALETEVKSGIWDIVYKEDENSAKKLKIYIVMPDFESLKISGEGEINIEEFENLKNVDLSIGGKGEIRNTGSLTAESVRIEITGKGKVNLDLKTPIAESVINGNGEIEIRGFASKMKVNIAGFGTFKSYAAESDEAEINITGKGVCEMNTKNILEINITGQGDVSYNGEPEIKKNVTGKIKLNKKK